MGAALIPFSFEGHQVRVFERGTDLWFVAGDVGRVLGYAHTPHLLRLLDDDEKGVHTVDTLGGAQDAAVLSEPGLYRAIMQRRAGEAIEASIVEQIARFQRWVYHDVLPTIRKTGAYATPAKALTGPRAVADTFRSYFGIARLIGMDRNQSALGAARATVKATGIDPLAQIEATHLIAPRQERHITATEIGQRMEIGSAKLTNKLLERHGYHQEVRDPQGKLTWEPSDKGRPFAVILDTGKTSGGAPVRQLRWSLGVIAALQADIAAADPSSPRHD